jgi:hypothetical protein
MTNDAKKQGWTHRLSELKPHAFELVVMVASFIGAIWVATDGRFLLTCVFLFVAIVCLGRVTRARKNK